MGQPFGTNNRCDGYPQVQMEQDPPLLPIAWETIHTVWYSYLKGLRPQGAFGVYDMVREDTFWLDKA